MSAFPIQETDSGQATGAYHIEDAHVSGMLQLPDARERQALLPPLLFQGSRWCCTNQTQQSFELLPGHPGLITPPDGAELAGTSMLMLVKHVPVQPVSPTGYL